MVDQRREVRPDGRKVPAVGQPWKRGGRKEQETPPPQCKQLPPRDPSSSPQRRGCWMLPTGPRAAFSGLWDPEGDPGSALKDLVVGNTHSHKMPERQFGTSCCHKAASGGLCKERGEGAECPSFSLLPGGRTEEQAGMGLLVLSLSPSPPFFKEASHKGR